MTFGIPISWLFARISGCSTIEEKLGIIYEEILNHGKFGIPQPFSGRGGLRIMRISTIK